MTCGPSELTQAMHSCAAIALFLFAMSVKASTMAKLCFMDLTTKGESQRYSIFHTESYVFLEPRKSAAEIALCTTSQFPSCSARTRSLARNIFGSFDLSCQETSSKRTAERRKDHEHMFETRQGHLRVTSDCHSKFLSSSDN